MTPLILLAVLVLAVGVVALLRSARRELLQEEADAPRRLSEAIERLKAGNHERVPALLAAALHRPADGRYSRKLLDTHRTVLLIAKDELPLSAAERRLLEAYLAHLEQVASAKTLPLSFDNSKYEPVRSALLRHGGRLAPDPQEQARVRFGQAVLRRVHQAGARQATFHADEFCLKMPGAAFLHLGSGFGPWQAATSAEERGKVEAGMVDLLLRPERVPESYAEAGPRLLPRLKSHTARAIGRLFLQLKDSEIPVPPAVAVGGDLVAELMWDGERTVSEISQETLDRWGVTFEEAMARALRNLAERKDLVVTSLGSETEQKVWMSCTEDFHNSARLLVPQVLRGLRLPERVVAMAPVEGHLLLSNPQDPTGMHFLLQCALDSLEEGGRPLSTVLLELDGEEWKPWDLPEDHPSMPLLRRLRLLATKLQYDRQQALLKALHERQDKDVFVGTLMVYEKEGGEPFSVCTWSDGVHTLLPKADHVAFMGGSDLLGELPWEVATKGLGDLMVPCGLVPERFEVKEFPSKERLQALGAATSR